MLIRSTDPKAARLLAKAQAHYKGGYGGDNARLKYFSYFHDPMTK